VLFGRYEGSGEGNVTVTGRRNERTERFGASATFTARSDANDYIPRLWASRKLGDLDRRIRSAQNDGATRAQVSTLIDELRETALRYGLLSEYTAYLVQEPQRIVAEQFGAVGNVRGSAAAAPPASPPPPVTTGRGAVVQAEAARQQREAASMVDMVSAQKLTESKVAADAAGRSVRIVAGRGFTQQRDSTWQDSRQGTQRVVKIQTFSPAYFEVLKALPEVALVAQQLPEVLIAGERASVQFDASGTTQLAAADLRRLVTEFRTK
jgi:hypothetical protein